MTLPNNQNERGQIGMTTRKSNSQQSRGGPSAGNRLGATRSRSGRKIRYAVVGLGHIAQVAVLPGFRGAKNSELAAIVSGDPQKLNSVARKYRLAKEQLFSYEEYDRALLSADAVYITVPNHLHKEYAVRAANAGVHVICEKPMAVTREECKAMIDAASQNRVKLMIAYRLHFERANLEAAHLAAKGKLGDIRIFGSDFTQNVAEGNVRVTEPVERGGGALYDMGVYCINAARYLLRDEPVSVVAVVANNGEKRFRQVEEMISVIMKFPEERLATFTCSFGAADISRYVLIGTRGTLTADPAYDYSMGLKHQLTIGEKTSTTKFPKRDQFAAEIMYFSDCVLKNKEPEPSGLEGLADVAIVQAIYKSVRTGQPTELKDLPAKRKPNLRQEIHRPAHGKPDTVKAKSPSGKVA
jgi:glucose-fructose oxidoreductase